MRMEPNRFALALLCTCLLCGAARSAQKPPEQSPALLPLPQDSISAEAIKYGAALEEQATPELKKWVSGYIKQLREKPVDPKATMADVDARFPAASDEARDAVIFLTYYLAHKDENEEQRMLGLRVRDIDRETTEIVRQIKVMQETDNLRSGSTNGQLTIAQRLQMDEEIRKREAQLREYGEERQLKTTRIAASRKKVNSYLKLLDVARKRMKDVSPTLLRDVRPAA